MPGTVPRKEAAAPEPIFLFFVSRFLFFVPHFSFFVFRVSGSGFGFRAHGQV